MAIVMSNDGGTFRARIAELVRGVKFSERRRLQMIAAWQGIAALAAVCALGVGATNMVAEKSDLVVMNPVVSMSVGQGETLWTLARRYGNPSASQLDRVDTLARANGLSASAMLHPGQRLTVPVENPREAAKIQMQSSLAKR